MIRRSELIFVGEYDFIVIQNTNDDHHKIKSNLSLYSLYYVQACIESAGPSPRYCAQATQLLPKKCRSGGEQLATLCPIWLAQHLNLRTPATIYKLTTKVFQAIMATPCWRIYLTAKVSILVDLRRRTSQVEKRR